jgi:tRNA G18 (ribose-2'-O)-methylase SpoU
VIIDDPADPRLADYVGLTDVVRRTKHEPEKGFFLAEGAQVMQRAAAAGYPLRSVLLASNRELPAGLPDAPVYQASYDVLEAVTGFHVHRGALASFGRLPLPTAEEVLAGAERVLVLEDINNHTNLGAILRSSDALGMDAVLLSPNCCDPLYRRAIRVSMGACFSIPYAYTGAWPEAITGLQECGFRVLALTPAAGATNLNEVDFGPNDRVALLLGAEGPGLSDRAMALSDERVRIPMSGGVGSLNVAAAAAIAMWEASRGR